MDLLAPLLLYIKVLLLILGSAQKGARNSGKDLEIIARAAWRVWINSALGSHTAFWKVFPGSRRPQCYCTTILRRCYLSQNRDPVIGVKIPLSEGRQGDPHSPPSRIDTLGRALFHVFRQGRSLIGTSNILSSPDSITWPNFLPAFTGYRGPRCSAPVLYWLDSPALL